MSIGTSNFVSGVPEEDDPSSNVVDVSTTSVVDESLGGVPYGL